MRLQANACERRWRSYRTRLARFLHMQKAGIHSELFRVLVVLSTVPIVLVIVCRNAVTMTEDSTRGTDTAVNSMY